MRNLAIGFGILLHVGVEFAHEDLPKPNKAGAAATDRLKLWLNKGGLMRDRLARSERCVNLDTLQQWCVDQGLEDFWQPYVVGKTTFDPRAKFAEVGFNSKGDGDGETDSVDL